MTDKPPISSAVVEAVMLLHTELMKRMTSRTASETWDTYCLDNLVSKIIDHLTRIEGHKLLEFSFGGDNQTTDYGGLGPLIKKDRAQP